MNNTNAPRSITEPLIAQSRAGEAGANLTDVLAACPFCGENPAHLGWPSIAFEIVHTPDCWIGGSQIIKGGYEKRRWNMRAANGQIKAGA